MDTKHKKAVFLDRDGTINRETGHLHSPSELEFIPGAIEAIREMRNNGFLVIVVTNQAGVAKGYYNEDEVIELHKLMNRRLVRANAGIDAFYYCPHHKEATVEKYRKDCICRKPNAGMIIKAIEEFGIDPGMSMMVGDKESDIGAGKNAGLAHNYLLRSGHTIDEIHTEADGVFDSLGDFVLKGGLGKVNNVK